MTRPRLRPDAYYVGTEDGLYALTNRGPVSFTGAALAQWLDRLAPHLTGERTVDELAEGLGTEQAAMLRTVIDALLTSGLAQEVPATPAEARAAAEHGEFAAQIGFLDYFHGHGEHEFARLRGKRVEVHGSDPLAPRTAAAFATFGLAEPELVAAPDAVASTADLIVLVDNGTAASPLFRMAGDDVPVTGVCLRGDAAWTLPVRHAIEATAALRSSSLRWSGLRTGGTTGDAALSTVARAAVAHQVAQRTICHATGTEKSTVADQAVAITDQPLRTDTHSWLPHPAVSHTGEQSAVQIVEHIAALRSRPALSSDEFSRLAASCMDDWFGPFTQVSERDFTQIPLSVAAIDVADPVGLRAAAGLRAPGTAVGYGPDLPSARQAAALQAFTAYGATMLDPRRLRPFTDNPPTSSDLDSSLRTLREQCWDGALGGVDLIDEAPVWLPVRAVFPLLGGDHRNAELVQAYGAGLGWADAVCCALVVAVSQIAATEAERRQTKLPVMRPDQLDPDPATEAMLRLCRAGGIDVEVRDLTPLLDLPVLELRGAGTSTCVGADSRSAALRLGTERLVLAGQIDTGHNARPASLPVHGHDQTIKALTTTLSGRGYQVVATVLDHDPALSEIMPFTVCVVIRR